MQNSTYVPPPRYLCTGKQLPFSACQQGRWKSIQLMAPVHSIERLEAVWCMQLRICRLGLTPDSRRRPLIHVRDRRQHGVVNRRPNVSRTQTQVVLEL